jgi:Domain of unknown function (DUF1707)
MSEQRELRVSDGERQVAADRLRAAHDEGRLDFSEYDNRLAQAYASVTYADLDRLFTDLPVRPSVPVAPSRAPAAPTSPAQVDTRKAFARLPLVLRILWINYAFVVVVNLTVWMLVGGGDTYFWPMWLAIPGVVLVGASAVTGAVRTHRRAALEG